MTLRRLLVVALLFLASSSFGAKTKIYWDDVQFGAARYKPTGTGWDSSVTIFLGWSPILQFDSFALRGELGFAWPRDTYQNRFLSMNYEAYLMVPIWSLLSIEAGGGMQYWRYEGGTTNPIASMNFCFRVEEWVDRVFFGYQRFFLAGRPVDQFRSGLAVNLFR
jgi:hypothetical protein